MQQQPQQLPAAAPAPAMPLAPEAQTADGATAQANAAGSQTGAAAAAAAEPPFFDPAARAPSFGNYDISWISNGTTSTLGAETTSRAGRKRAATASPMGMPPRHGRSQSPWPVPNLRAVHQRVEMPGSGSETGAVVASLIQQHEHDRDFINLLKDNVVTLHDRLVEHDRQVSKWRSWSEDNARKLLELESRVQQTSAAKAEAMRKEMGKEFSAKFPGVLNEMTSKALDKRMQGAEAKLKDIEAKLQEHRAMQSETAIYLQRLNQERPQEGQSLIQAFQWVEGQIEELKRDAGTVDAGVVKKIAPEESQNLLTPHRRGPRGAGHQGARAGAGDGDLCPQHWVRPAQQDHGRAGRAARGD